MVTSYTIDDLITFYCQRYERGEDDPCELLAHTQCQACKRIIKSFPNAKLLDNRLIRDHK